MRKTLLAIMACGAALAAPKPQIYSMAWSVDGKTIAAGGFREVRLMDAAGKQTGTLPGEIEAVRAVAFSRDAKLLAAAGGVAAKKGEVKIWDLAKREVLVTIAGHADSIYGAAFSSDAKTPVT